MELIAGIEPVTSPLPRECSTSEPQGQAISRRTILLSKKPVIGIEPTTYGLQNRCSTVELCRRHMSILLRKNFIVKNFFVYAIIILSLYKVFYV